MKKSQGQEGAFLKRSARVVVQKNGATVMQQVFQTSPVKIGRLLDNDLVLPFDFVSRYHCELHFRDGQWIAVDKGSKNGLVINGSRVSEIPLGLKGSFVVQDLVVLVEQEAERKDRKEESSFDSLRQGQTIVEEISVSMAMPDVRSPLLNFDLNKQLFAPHPQAVQSKERALQIVTVWHDQVLDAREIRTGQALNWDWQGDSQYLGEVKGDKTVVKIPKGCFAVGTGQSGAQQLVCLPHEPVAFRVTESIFVFLRYVPKSKDLPRPIALMPDDRFIDPLVLSAGIHGAMAVTAIIIGYKGHQPPREDPDRFAKIIMPAPTPIPLIEPPKIAEATPTPPPIPTPEPVKKIEVVKKEEPKKIKIVEKKVKKPVAIAKKENPPKLPPPPPDAPPPPKVAELAPAPPPAPTAPPFNPRALGALKTLSILKPGPASNVANVERITISRAPASVAGSMIGAQAVKGGTGEIISQLQASAQGKEEGTAGVAVGGKGTATYGVAGLKGKAGNRAVQGSVLGGASYTEISKNEGLSRDQVMKVVAKYTGQIQQCYERSLMDNPDIVGRAEFEWEITSGGDVTFVKVKEATVKNGETLLTCVKGVFGRMKFPIAKNGENTTPTIGLPFGRL